MLASKNTCLTDQPNLLQNSPLHVCRGKVEEKQAIFTVSIMYAQLEEMGCYTFSLAVIRN